MSSQSQVGEENQKKIEAARRVNETVPAGEILVLPAKEPLARALTSTKNSGIALVPPAALLALAKYFMPLNADGLPWIEDSLLLPLLGALWVLLNVGYKWYLNRQEIANAPGAGIASQ